MRKQRILMPLPDRDFDPTEACISWMIIRDAGHDVVFTTENGQRSFADETMISGEGLDPWGFIPVLKKVKLIGILLRARKHARNAYQQLQSLPAFQNPLKFSELKPDDFDGVLLPGGHAPGMRPYLENKVLQNFIVKFFAQKLADGNHKPVGAVCHGVVVLARSISTDTGLSVLHGKRTTALTWVQERAAWNLTRYFARFWDPLYFRTYSETKDEPSGYWSVESEVKRALKNDADFIQVSPGALNYRLKTGNVARDTLDDARPAWVVTDGNYVSARWPGDVHSFAKTFVSLLGN